MKLTLYNLKYEFSENIFQEDFINYNLIEQQEFNVPINEISNYPFAQGWFECITQSGKIQYLLDDDLFIKFTNNSSLTEEVFRSSITNYNLLKSIVEKRVNLIIKNKIENLFFKTTRKICPILTIDDIEFVDDLVWVFYVDYLHYSELISISKKHIFSSDKEFDNLIENYKST